MILRRKLGQEALLLLLVPLLAVVPLGVAAAASVVATVLNEAGTAKRPIEAPLVGSVPGEFTSTAGDFQRCRFPEGQRWETHHQSTRERKLCLQEYLHRSCYGAGGASHQRLGGLVEVTALNLIEARPGEQVTVVMVFDSSGSMRDNDPFDLRVDAGKRLLSVLKSDDQAAVIDFGGLLQGFHVGQRPLTSSSRPRARDSPHDPF